MNKKLKLYIYAVLAICILVGSSYLYTRFGREKDVEITLNETPKELLIGETGSLTFTIKNNTKTHMSFDISFESKYFDTNSTFKEELDPNKAGSFTLDMKAKNIDENSKKTNFKIIVRSEEKSFVKNLEIIIKKPDVIIEEVKPDKLKVKAKSTKYISVRIKNKEKIDLTNLKIILTSEYRYYSIDREGLEKIDGSYVYAINESLLYNEDLSKTFYITSDLTPGSMRVEYILKVELLWKDFLMDEKNVYLEVEP